MTLNTIWFILVVILLAGYAVLDGFDLGVGILYPWLAREDKEKRVLLSALGPFWDGNEVWLLTGGGALFAAFPLVYATVFSGFYLALMLVLFALILRAVAIEYRNKLLEKKQALDVAFFLGSLLPALLFGVAVGNIARGIPLNAGQNYAGTFWTLLNPYSLLLGLVGLAAFILQGATYAMVKTKGEIYQRARTIGELAWWSLVGLYLLATLYSAIEARHLFANYAKTPLIYVFPLLLWLGLGTTLRALRREKPLAAFVGSSLILGGMVATLAAGMYPNLVFATDPALNLTIYNASSSPLTLKTMFIIAALGVPWVLFYTAYVYYVFRGKAEEIEEGY
ncbi:cytochrome bd-I ubiquinol oxidase subunit 2 apoprotein [Thermanaeromonas toyohensis ToBE]|uniref:Cytochrome bd-I ubiquinol oxidase subunit 2 apoprotein n=1 Tax=Thermanaeromonas toyohensis ToBE TaxID=698762 RepID=A0A1W1VGK3_9FIRM|nr:cytochrome d ubiquinol oxidase subunit II [Thermanaeromonas toyohensis]SMB92495.1 cytochrome bd-I ubiquinol oxidase subunit 2 apoprotein [Thermanaeromonas toyohensis ToBE]